MSVILGYLSKKSIAIIVILLALLGVVCAPLAFVQAAQIHGVTIFGWTPVKGYVVSLKELKLGLDSANSQVAIAARSVSTCQTALDKQNAAIKAMGAETYARMAAQARVISAAEDQNRKLNGRLSVFLAASPGGLDELSQYRDIDAKVQSFIKNSVGLKAVKILDKRAK